MSQSLNLGEAIGFERESVVSIVDAVNRKTMNAAARSCYARSRELKDAEAAALKQIAEAVGDQPILDLGFGGGGPIDATEHRLYRCRLR